MIPHKTASTTDQPASMVRELDGATWGWSIDAATHARSPSRQQSTERDLLATLFDRHLERLR
ncbi:hypothetical protein SynA1825c_01403 [Synechococcus sp. A18-25c]|nr:hypothetical protein SynA1825c_01403 [Synechococcus sp. A18-25c]